MMDCSTFKELSGLRVADLPDEDQLALDQHLADCALCRREQRDDEELLALVDRWPREASAITAADIRALDGADTPLTSEQARPGRGRGLQLLQVAMAIAAMLLVGLLVVPRLLTERPVDPGVVDGQRLKGAVGTPATQPRLNLYFSVETAWSSDAEIQPGQESGAYGPDQGIIFGVLTEDSGGAVTLLEQAPDGTLQALTSGSGVRWGDSDVGDTSLVDSRGQHVVWRPDGPTGQYRYTAMLTRPSADTLPPSDLAALLRGEPVPGVELLAADSFAIEWTAGDRGVDTH